MAVGKAEIVDVAAGKQRRILQTGIMAAAAGHVAALVMRSIDGCMNGRTKPN